MGNNVNLGLDITSAATASGGSGVTSITSNNGLTSATNPITGTGTINQVRVSSLTSTGPSPQASLTTAVSNVIDVPVYGSSYPENDCTIVNRGRVGFNFTTNSSTNQKMSAQGIQLFDTMTLGFDIEFQCVSGSFAIFQWQGGGVFSLASAFSFTTSPILCTGSQQTEAVSASGTIGLDFGSFANDGYTTNANTDFLKLQGTFTNVTSGYIQMNNLNWTITQN